GADAWNDTARTLGPAHVVAAVDTAAATDAAGAPIAGTASWGGTRAARALTLNTAQHSRPCPSLPGALAVLPVSHAPLLPRLQLLWLLLLLLVAPKALSRTQHVARVLLLLRSAVDTSTSSLAARASLLPWHWTLGATVARRCCAWAPAKS